MTDQPADNYIFQKILYIVIYIMGKMVQEKE